VVLISLGLPSVPLGWLSGISGWLGSQSGRLVLDLDRNLCQRIGVLAVVVRAEQQFSGPREQNTYIRGRSTPIAQVAGG
jgi:hypothetical protein